MKLWKFVFDPLSTLSTGAVVASLAALVAASVPIYQENFASFSVVIATSPTDAAIKVDGAESGKSPAKLELRKGIHTVEATLPGYETEMLAIFVSSTGGNAFNMDLGPLPNPETTSSGLTESPSVGQAELSRLLAEMQKLKEALILDPEEALSLPLLREKMRTQEELSRALRDDLRDVKGERKWYLGSMFLLLVGLLAVIAQLAVANKNAPEA